MSKKSNRIASALTVLAGICVAAVLLLRSTQASLPDDYAKTYIALALFSIVHAGITFTADFLTSKNTELSKALFLFERGNKTIGILFAIYGIVGAVMGLSVLFSGFLFFNIPFQAQLATTSTANSLFLGAFIPAIFEEWAVFAGIQATTWFILLMLSLSRKTKSLSNSAFTRYAIMFFVIGAFAYLFATAHFRYGGDQPTLLYAFGFEYAVQWLNVLSGGLFSPLLHFANNAGGILHG